MSPGRGSKNDDTPAPSPEVPAPFRDGFDKNEVMKELRQISKDIASLTTKVERLIVDEEKTRDHVDMLRHSITWAKGFGVAAILLIPACAGIVWWLIGGELNQIRDKLYSIQLPAAISQPAAPATPASPPTTP